MVIASKDAVQVILDHELAKNETSQAQKYGQEWKGVFLIHDDNV